MIAGKKYQGPVVDIWSLGVILFALVSGYLPFEDPNTSALYKKILAGDYKPPRFISSDVKDLIRRILETDPRKRFSIDDIRRHTWYQQIPESAIPREVISEEDKLKIHLDIINSLESKGLPKESVMDALRNNAFNSTTANYYLLEQKIRTKLIQDRKKSEELKAAKKKDDKSLGSSKGKVAAPPPQPKSKSDKPPRPSVNKPEKSTQVEGDTATIKSVASNKDPAADVSSAASTTDPCNPLSRAESRQNAEADKENVTADVTVSRIAEPSSVDRNEPKVHASKAIKIDESRIADAILPPIVIASKTKSIKAKHVTNLNENSDNDFDDSTLGEMAEGAARPSDNHKIPRNNENHVSEITNPRSAMIEKLFNIQPQMFNQQKLKELRQQQISKALQQRHQNVKLERLEKKPHLVRDQLDAPQTMTILHQDPNKETKAPQAILSLLKLKYPKFAGESTKVTIRMPKTSESKNVIGEKKKIEGGLAVKQSSGVTEAQKQPHQPEDPAPSEVRPVSRHARARLVKNADFDKSASNRSSVSQEATEGPVVISAGQQGVEENRLASCSQIRPPAQDSALNSALERVSRLPTPAHGDAEEVRPEAQVEAVAPKRRSVMSNLLASIIS